MNTEVMFSSKSDNWATPADFFRALDAEFHFTVDVCASKENAKCPAYFTKEQDGLAQEWRGGYSGAIPHTAEKSAVGCRKRQRLPVPS